MTLTYVHTFKLTQTQFLYAVISSLWEGHTDIYHGHSPVALSKPPSRELRLKYFSNPYTTNK